MAAEYRLVTVDWPIDGERQVLADAEGQAILNNDDVGYSFVWLTNPVLFITFAKKL